ncbi:MAG: hypothetical protein CVU08_06855 [Bacteroidetes bacterium HGW-Bacteroidetes-3]|jgi:hypothetical protein|nr:MAG: hypothetical protein CVU08_06855 [Bacteroidetes bacterium HGW-Bacteroidetes-3]
MVTAKFNQQTNILESKFEGNVILSEIVNYIITTKENKSYPRKLKILTDSVDGNFNFTIDDLKIIVEENYKSLEKYELIIDAIIIDDPKNTVLSMLYLELAKTNKYKFEIFATKSAAIDWLNNY